MSEDTGAAERIQRFEPVAVYIGSGEYRADCQAAQDGDYVLLDDVHDLLASQARELEELRRIFYDGARGVQPIIDERDALRQQLAEAREVLRRYRSAQRRMRDRWAEGDENVKQDLWRALHACEEAADVVLAASEQGEREGQP